MDISHLLEKSMQDHDHLCPRQILGVRIGLAGMKAVGFMQPPTQKELLTIVETDGCFVDGLIAATCCTVGHRTLRVEDYGKVAATFVNVTTNMCVRVAPRLDARVRASECLPDAPTPYSAQLEAYQVLPDQELLTLQTVHLNTSIEQIVSKPGLRVNCDLCGEEIMNAREIVLRDVTLCRSCRGTGYYAASVELEIHV